MLNVSAWENYRRNEGNRRVINHGFLFGHYPHSQLPQQKLSLTHTIAVIPVNTISKASAAHPHNRLSITAVLLWSSTLAHGVENEHSSVFFEILS